MEITFTFGSEEIDCEELAKKMGLAPRIDNDGNVTITHALSNEDLKNIEELKKLRMEDLCRAFYSDPLADETIAIHWQENF